MNDYRQFLIKYGEIGIKGKNRYIFEEDLGIPQFDPYDESQVDLSGLPYVVVPGSTEE